MSSKNTYWVVDTEGTYALVEGADQRDRWARVHGWTEADEPDPQDFVWLRHDDDALEPTRLTWAAAQLDAWAGRGWTPGAPPEPINAAIAHWPATEPAKAQAAEPALKSSPKASAASGDKTKE